MLSEDIGLTAHLVAELDELEATGKKPERLVVILNRPDTDFSIRVAYLRQWPALKQWVRLVPERQIDGTVEEEPTSEGSDGLDSQD